MNIRDRRPLGFLTFRLPAELRAELERRAARHAIGANELARSYVVEMLLRAMRDETALSGEEKDARHHEP